MIPLSAMRKCKDIHKVNSIDITPPAQRHFLFLDLNNRQGHSTFQNSCRVSQSDSTAASDELELSEYSCTILHHLKFETPGRWPVAQRNEIIDARKIRRYGETIEEKKIVEKILRSLPQRFEHVVMVIEESKDLSSLSRHDLMGSLEAREKRTSRYSEQPIKQAFQSKMNIAEKKYGERRRRNLDQQQRNFRSQRGGRSNSSRGHGRGRYNQNRPRDYDKSSSQCNICKKNDHDIKDYRFRECPNLKNAYHKYIDCPKKNENEANFSESKDGEQLFYTCGNAQEDEGV
ncbi:hypothetical protein RJ639_001656 [Escallonia herrerae]|uniref:Gag-pol polyprotein n=1 Tax=Escallonia herrerae TaxID=1293975 RepID=A0AA88XFP6_9ASTE|nr:hypothetical protein RJ639_001656 [Escallonia herrerae]